MEHVFGRGIVLSNHIVCNIIRGVDEITSVGPTTHTLHLFNSAPPRSPFGPTRTNRPMPLTLSLCSLFPLAYQSVFNDLWAVDLPGGNAWRQIPTTSEFPLPRIGHSAVAMGNRILIYGGRNFNTGQNSSPYGRGAMPLLSNSREGFDHISRNASVQYVLCPIIVALSAP